MPMQAGSPLRDDPLSRLPPVQSYDCFNERDFADVEAQHKPAVLRGLVGEWPAVTAAQESDDRIAGLLREIDSGAPVRAFLADAAIEGRYFYRPQLDGFNFGVVDSSIAALLTTLLDPVGSQSGIYLGSTPTREILPAFASAHPMPILSGRSTEPRIWIGNFSRVAPHYDESDNVACVVSGRRRFVLFPPEQVKNLYVGPIDQTIAGQPSSFVNVHKPDFARFPRFADALRSATIAELGPGDAIYIPALWWHAVEARGPLNVLVNYWWQDSPMDAGSPLHALGHALLAVSHLPEHQRLGWRSLFDHYAFKVNGEPAEHIPEGARGILGASTPAWRAWVRKILISKLMGR